MLSLMKLILPYGPFLIFRLSRLIQKPFIGSKWDEGSQQDGRYLYNQNEEGLETSLSTLLVIKGTCLTLILKSDPGETDLRLFIALLSKGK